MNKDIFIKVINNKVIFNLIFSNIHYIHKDIIKPENIFKWFEILNKPQLLAYYNYEKEFKQYYSNNKFYSPRNGFETHQHVLYNLISTNNLQLLKYLLEDLNVDNKHLRKIQCLKKSYQNNGDLLFLALVLNKSEIVNYLTTSPIIGNKIEWNYYNALFTSPYYDDFKFFKQLCDRIDLTSLEQNNIENLLTNIVDQREERLDMFEYIIEYMIDADLYITKRQTYQFIEIQKTIFKRGHINIVKKLFKSNILVRDDSAILREALYYNQLHLVKWLHENRFNVFSAKVHDHAASSGSLELIKWISENRTEGFRSKAMTLAAEAGSLEIIQWLHYNRSDDVCTINVMDAAIINGDFDMVQWLINNRTEGCSDYILDISAEDSGIFNIDLIKLLHSQFSGTKPLLSAKYMDLAAKNGRLDVVQFLHFNRIVDCTVKAMDEAARMGHLEIVKWLHENRTEGCTTRAIQYATNNCHIDVVKWLHENRTEGFHTNAFYINKPIAQQTAMIQWLHFNRSELFWTTDAMDGAIDNGNLGLAKWLHENRSESCSDNAVQYAAQNGDIEMLQWLYDNKLNNKLIFKKSEWPMNFAAKNGHMEILEWLKKNNYPCTSHGWFYAAENNHLEILIWFSNNFTEIFSTSTLISPLIKNPTIINWLKNYSK